MQVLAWSVLGSELVWSRSTALAPLTTTHSIHATMSKPEFVGSFLGLWCVQETLTKIYNGDALVVDRDDFHRGVRGHARVLNWQHGGSGTCFCQRGADKLKLISYQKLSEHSFICSSINGKGGEDAANVYWDDT